MFKFVKSNLAETETRNDTSLKITAPETYNLIPFEVYRIGILHPDAWHIYVNPSKSFSFYDGFAKIDRSSEKNCADQASLALRWAKLKQETTIDEYMEEIKIQYKRKQKKNKKDRFEILSINAVDGLPHKSYLMVSSIRANHSVYRAMGKEESICSMQLTTYCDITKRLVIASIAFSPEDSEKKIEAYKQILFSLKCH